jgi:hypothetical protein
MTQKYHVTVTPKGNYVVVDANGKRLAWRDTCGDVHEWTDDKQEAQAIATRESAIARMRGEK